MFEKFFNELEPVTQTDKKGPLTYFFWSPTWWCRWCFTEVRNIV